MHSVRIGWLVSNASRYSFLNLSCLYFPGKLMNESISDVRTSLRWIQLYPDGRMMMRMVASRGDYSLMWAPNHVRDLVFFTFTKLMPCHMWRKGLVIWKILCWFDWDLKPGPPAWKADTLTIRSTGICFQ